MVLAHQYLGQLEPKLQEAFAANTAIKFAGGVSAKDARTLAPMLYATPELIEAQPKGSFAAHVRGRTKSAVPLSFPFGYMEKLPRMDKDDRTTLRQRMRERYAVHFSELEKQGEEQTPEPQPAQSSVQAAPTSSKSRKPKAETAPDKTPPGHIDTTPGESW